MTATPTLRRTDVETMIKRFADHQAFCQSLDIRNKEGVSVPYRNSPAGRKLNKAIRKQEQAGDPVRIVMLKAAQVWASSSAATEIFRRIPFWPGRRALVLADSDMHADLVFGYYQQFIKSYTDHPYGGDFQSALKLPRLEKDTERHLRWANQSSILVGTAYNVDIGRSAPFNWAHLSEAAFYRNLALLMTGLMARVPQSTDSGVIVESTANGAGGDFYDLCQRAMDPRRPSGWEFVFFGYHEHPEYRLKAPPDFRMTQDERAEQQKYNLHADQVYWRRQCIDTTCEGRIDRFHQEYPGNPQEAFLSSGRTIFDMQSVARLRQIHDAPRGRLEVIDVGLQKRIQFIQNEDGRGELVVYRLPQKGGRYCIGIDHAEGIDPQAKAGGSSDPDYCSATVIDIDTGEEAAKLKERYEPHPWAERIYWLGKYFNWAFLAPEQKAVGKAVIGQLLTLQYPLELIYSKQRDPSDRRPALLQELGFDTNSIFRPVLIAGLDRALRDGSLQLHDPETLQQLREFVRKPTGREEGIRHDDDVFSAALAVEGLPYARRAHDYRAERSKDPASDWRPQRYGQRARAEDDDDD